MTRRVFVPHKYQGLIIEHQSDVERTNVWAGMGLGKTVSTLTTLESLYALGIETQPTLVIAPLRVARSTWPDECEKWEHLRGLEVVPILGDANNRAMQLRRDAPIFSINYENLPWLIDWFKHNPRPWPFGTVVADESTKLKSTRISNQKSKLGKEFLKGSGGSVRGRALAQVAHTKVKRWTNLTGTPSPNGLKDLWGQQWFIDGGQRLGRSYSAFESRWFQSVKGDRGYHAVEPLDHAQEQIQQALRDCTISLDPADWFDLEKPIVRPVYVDLPSGARRLYQDMERKMFMEIGEHEVEALNAASRTMKCLQLANGAAYVDDAGNWKDVHDEKLHALEDIVEEAAGMPVLVAYHFKSDLARLARAFPRGRQLDQNPQTIRDWNAGKIPVLFAHPASAGHGLNLQDGGNILAFFGHWWNLEEFQQIIERIGPVRQLQAGHRRPMFIYHIIARDTIDEDVMLRRETKREVQDILLDAMKSKGLRV
ncbi:DEAD/DEAH box helicase [Paraburkholderia sartisoli]|uniref:SNF2 family N-terminal domain-containing protein n=1 Tax=Paraburkholderia sartisoli TaxID=83784 RepID=A0A1H4HSM3_9BURK|nr:DEAD/DEAH box helicase [Paraburkholderia sartisoli]SEB24829.1 SNF2 family N-terminal domain-containing protein [Paraburkholderia sartisoli]